MSPIKLQYNSLIQHNLIRQMNGHSSSQWLRSPHILWVLESQLTTLKWSTTRVQLIRKLVHVIGLESLTPRLIHLILMQLTTLHTVIKRLNRTNIRKKGATTGMVAMSTL